MSRKILKGQYSIKVPTIVPYSPYGYSTDQPSQNYLIDFNTTPNRNAAYLSSIIAMSQPTSQSSTPEPTVGGNSLKGLLNNISSEALISASGIAASLIDRKHDDTSFEAQQAVGNFLMKQGAVGKIIGTAWNTASDIAEAKGWNTSTINKDQQDVVNSVTGGNVTKGKKLLNNISTIIPMAGLLGKQTIDAEHSFLADQARGGYANTLAKMDIMDTMGGKRYTNWNDVNTALIQNNSTNATLTNIVKTNTLRKQSDAAEELTLQNFKRINGINGISAVGKNGMKLLSREELDRIYSSKKPVETTEQMSKFQNGGSILIPEGALHAHKHHMEEENPELAEELTKKGIPVVVTDENGEVEQVAEIEKEEITLTLPLTQQIEALWHSGTEEDMIKCGKLIVEKLFNDCEDNANLINKIK